MGPVPRQGACAGSTGTAFSVATRSPVCSCRCLAGFGFIDATNAVQLEGDPLGALGEQAVPVIEAAGVGGGSEEPPESGPAAGTA